MEPHSNPDVDAAEDSPDGSSSADGGGGTCTLCDLPVPDPPVTDTTVGGEYCCRGCLEIARVLDDPSTKGAEGGSSAAIDPGSGPAPDRVREAFDEGLASGGIDTPDTTDAIGTADGDDRTIDGETAFLAVGGMHCATCEAFIEGRATAREGVLDAAASYPQDTVKLTYDPRMIDRETLPSIVDGLGYHARLLDRGDGSDTDTTEGTDSIGRLLVGGFFGMMVMLWYVLFLYPIYLDLPSEWLLLDVRGPAGGYLLANAWVLTTVVLAYTGFPLLRGAYVSLRARRPNMDLLVALAAGTAYLYSTLAVLLGRTEVYFDIAVVIVLAVTVGSYYENRVKRRVVAGLTDLTEERVDKARRRTGDGTETVPVEELAAGDRVLVKPGERIPIDGVVREGHAAVDESLVTGESLPVERKEGERVVGGTFSLDGALVVEVGPNATSTVDRLTALLWEARSSRPGVARLVDRIAAVFVPAVIVLAVGAAAGHAALGEAPTAALLAGLAVLVVSCPCALGLATPLAVARGLGEALATGIVVTNGAVFERADEVDVLAFDKTGTLTTGEMELVHWTDAETQERAAAVEQYSEHPIAEAILERAGPSASSVTGFERHPGRGVSAVVDGDPVVVGRADLFADRGWRVPDGFIKQAETAREAGRIPSLVGWDGAVRGIVVAGDRPRDGWAEVVDRLGADRRIVVLTGDSDSAAARFRGHPGIDEVFAGVPPNGKTAVIDRLGAEETVAMVGDGSNDAPALAAADLGIALERGTRLAADAADVVITTDDLRTVPQVFELTAATRRRIRENLAWAFCYNAVAIPLAVAGALNPLFAALAMAASSLLVVANSSRSLLATPDGSETDSVFEREEPSRADRNVPDRFDGAAMGARTER